VEEERCESRPLPSPPREPFPKILALEMSPPPAQVLSSCAEDDNSVLSCGTTCPAEESPEAIPPRGGSPTSLSPSKTAAAAAAAAAAVVAAAVGAPQRLHRRSRTTSVWPVTMVGTGSGGSSPTEVQATG